MSILSKTLTNRKCFFIAVYILLNISVQAQTKLKVGLSQSTESFNIEKYGEYFSYNNTNWQPIIQHVNFDQMKFFSAVFLNVGCARPLTKNSFIEINTYSTYVHHYYKGARVSNNTNIPEVKKIKMDIFLDYGRIFFAKNKYSFKVAMGAGLTNINSGYDVTYSEVNYLGTVVQTNYQGNWFRVSPRLLLGVIRKNISFEIDGLFTKDPNFTDLLSVMARGTLAYSIDWKKLKTTLH